MVLTVAFGSDVRPVVEHAVGNAKEWYARRTTMTKVALQADKYTAFGVLEGEAGKRGMERGSAEEADWSYCRSWSSLM